MPGSTALTRPPVRAPRGSVRTRDVLRTGHVSLLLVGEDQFAVMISTCGTASCPCSWRRRDLVAAFASRAREFAERGFRVVGISVSQEPPRLRALYRSPCEDPVEVALRLLEELSRSAA